MQESSESTETRHEAISIGSILKSARKRQNLTLAAVSAKTKIHQDILACIEEDPDYAANLPEIYLKNYTKQYCKLLGVSVPDQLNKLAPTFNEPVKQTYSAHSTFKLRSTLNNRRPQEPTWQAKSKRSSYKTILALCFLCICTGILWQTRQTSLQAPSVTAASTDIKVGPYDSIIDIS